MHRLPLSQIKMKMVISIFLVGFYLVSFGQDDTILLETQYELAQHREKKYERYYVTLPDSVFNGEYERYSIYGKAIIKGQYENGKRVGIWSYYSNDVYTELVQQLDWDKGKTVFRDTIKFKRSYPYFFGGNEVLEEYLRQKIEDSLTEKELKMYKGKKVTVEFNIDDNGYTSNVRISAINNEINNSRIEIELIEIITNMPKWEWGQTESLDLTIQQPIII